MSHGSPRIITLEEGWDNEIKKKAIDRLEVMLDGGMKKGTQMFLPREYVETYTTCYNMCTQRNPYNWSRELYSRHGETIASYLTRAVLPALREKRDSQLLVELKYRWENHVIMNKWLKKFFTYLDRYYVKHNTLPTLSLAGLRHFQTLVYEEVRGDVCSAMLHIIDREREGEIVDRDLVKSCVELFETMGMGTLDAYAADFEGPLLQNTREYYRIRRQEWIVSDSTPEYLVKAERALGDEKARVVDYLNPSSEAKILKVCEEEILEEVETILLDKEGSGCRVLLANNKSDDLRRMFRLFARIENGLVPMAAIVREFISGIGNEHVLARQARLDAGEKDRNDDPEFVKSLLKLHDKYLGVVKDTFDGHSLFQRALKDAFVEITNRNVGAHTNAELMSTYCDRVLKSVEKLNEEEVEESLDRVVQLFSYLTDKDLFAEIYRNQLAKRLLNQRSLSSDAEKSMIAKLKMQCGTHFTSKIEGMLADLAVGSDQKNEFAEKVKRNDKVKLDFSVQVLTTGFWPTYKSPDVTVPAEMTSCMDVFQNWHDSKHAKRKLTWQYSLGNASVRATFNKKTYDLQVSTLQAVALNAFNGDDKYTFTELQMKLNLDESVLKPLMHSLSCGKHKVIAKDPPGDKIKKTDSFQSNSKFSSNMRKIRIQMASLEASHSLKRVEEERTNTIEAAVVRIMKARKTLGHQALIAEVLQQLALFSPKPQSIKRRIEALIDREYLERDRDSPGTYNYLA